MTLPRAEIGALNVRRHVRFGQINVTFRSEAVREFISVLDHEVATARATTPAGRWSTFDPGG
jgi:hypothetical protein